MSVETRQKINDLTGELNLWNPVKSKIEMGLGDIPLLQNFFKEWAKAMDNGEPVVDAYHDALETLPEDDPTTDYNEGVTEDQLKEKVKFFFGKPLSINPDDPDNAYLVVRDAASITSDLDVLKGKIRYFFGLQMMADSEIDTIQREIDRINDQVRIQAESGEGDDTADSEF